MRKKKLELVGAIFKKFNYLGLVGATLAFCLSLLPSLLPRPWLFQGIVTGVSMAVGYGCGSGLSWGLRWLLEWEPPKKLKRIAWSLVAIIAPVVAVTYLFLSGKWQTEVSRLVGEEPQSHRYILRILAVALITSALLLYTSRLVRYATRQIITFVDKLLPRKVSILTGLLVITWLLVTIFNGLFFANFVRFANRTYSRHNQGTPIGAVRPSAPERSGSPQSVMSWETLGYQGRGFVGRGPSNQQISSFSGVPAKTPIRLYAGLESAPTIGERAALIVKELERTNAFERKVLVIANATGTGWLEPQSVDSIEYMYGGDTAIASIQYSYLPSWLSFLVDKQNAKDAGRELFNAIYGKWATLPADKRPKLITYGLSLGSYGGQAAFSGANDLKYTTDGALFIGTPSDTELWKTITDHRDYLSPQIDPLYKNGTSIRFIDEPSDYRENWSDWREPRTLFLQHPSDPVVWFDFDLILNKPDWLSEKRGYDVSPSMQWYPFITFTQVALDQFLGTSAPNGHGHNYANKIVDAWAAVADPPNWTSSKSVQLQKIINTYSNE